MVILLAHGCPLHAIARELGRVSEATRPHLLRENVRELYQLPALTPVAG